MPAHMDPDGEITAMVMSRSPTHVVLSVEVSRAFLQRHASMLRELARLAERDPRDEEA